jgi:hypothetical protein
VSKITENFFNQIVIENTGDVQKNYQIYTVEKYVEKFLIERNISKSNKEKESKSFANKVCQSLISDWHARIESNRVPSLISKEYFEKYLSYYSIELPSNVEKKLFNKPEDLSDVEINEIDNWLTEVLPKKIIETASYKNEILAPSIIHSRWGNFYNLSDYPNIFTELSKIEPFNHKSLMNFTTNFGLPGENTSLYDFSYQTGFVYPSNFLSFLYIDLIEYKNVFNVFLKYMMEPGFFEDLPYEISSLHQPQIALSMNYKQEIIPKINISSLFDFAYFQMMKAILNHSELRTCKYCGHPFEVTYEGMKFCPPLPFRGRSSCEMAYNNRMKKAWNLYKKDHRTFEEIDMQVNLPIEEIKEYIQRRESEN